MYRKKISRVLRRAVGERRLLWETLLLLSATRVTLCFFPFQTVLGVLNRYNTQPGAAEEADSIRRVVWAINSASRLLGTTCLPRALAAQSLLSRRGVQSELRIGVARRPGAALEAHAWIEREGTIVIGRLPDLARFTQMPALNPNVSFRSSAPQWMKKIGWKRGSG